MGRAVSMSAARHAARLNAAQFKQAYVVFTASNGEPWVDRLSTFQRSLPSDAEIIGPVSLQSMGVSQASASKVAESIYQLLCDREWDADTFDLIQSLFRSAGFPEMPDVNDLPDDPGD